MNVNGFGLDGTGAEFETSAAFRSGNANRDRLTFARQRAGSRDGCVNQIKRSVERSERRKLSRTGWGAPTGEDEEDRS